MSARKRLTAAPPVGPREARRAVTVEVGGMFDDAHELTGCHPPYAMDAELEAIKAMRKVVLAALLDLPQRKLLALGRKLHELADARDFEIDQLQRDYEEYPLWKLSCSTPRRSRRGSGTFGGFGTPSKE